MKHYLPYLPVTVFFLFPAVVMLVVTIRYWITGHVDKGTPVQ